MGIRKEADKISNQEYLEYLINTYQNLIFSICYKMTQNYFEAQDLTQETFLSAFKKLNGFDKCYEKAWLSRIAVNKCLDYQKHTARKVQIVDEEELKNIAQPNYDTEKTILEQEVLQQLKEACQKLKSPYQEIALAYYYEEKEVSEVAEEFGRNVKTVQTQIYRARAQLRKLYGREWNR